MKGYILKGEWTTEDTAAQIDSLLARADMQLEKSAMAPTSAEALEWLWKYDRTIATAKELGWTRC